MYLRVEPHDPMVLRDGRPFDRGIETANRARTLEWVHPSVMAGSVRTLLGKLAMLPRERFSASWSDRLKCVAVAGPLPVRSDVEGRWLLYLPVPSDVLFYPVKDDAGSGNAREAIGAKLSGNGSVLRVAALVPYEETQEGAGCDIPDNLWPICVVEDGKPVNGPAFWSIDRMAHWLVDPGLIREIQIDDDRHYLQHPESETRTHVSIDAKRQVAEDGMLFQTTGLDLRNWILSVQVLISNDRELEVACSHLPRMQSLGGERRLAIFIQDKEVDWNIPEHLQQALAGAKWIRMVIITPALFSDGWRPGWLDENGEGDTPQAKGLRLRLRGATVTRWAPVSGWDLQAHGPKRTRRMVPAGSVYFFEVLSGDPGAYAGETWLRPVSDDEQDRLDGFGLAVWGIWNRQVDGGGIGG